MSLKYKKIFYKIHLKQ